MTDQIVDLPVTVPKAVALKGIPDVELVAVGSWNASTGPVTITDDDVNQAIAALDCPGIHNPVLKLGHEEPDPDGTHMRWDGEPAVGWISNMRLSANGAKVLGDYTGVPAWLVDVMPSAYPQRSVEIQRQFKCQIGHVHPFVITAVSLLGVYPPAVGVIKSLNDVQALYTLAAADGHPGREITRSIELAFALPGDNRDGRRELTDTEQRSTADFERDHREWEDAVAALLAVWPTITRKQRDQLTAQIADHIDSGHLTALASLDVDSDAAATALYEQMLAAAHDAAAEQRAEAARQGVVIPAAEPDEKWLSRVSASIAATMAASLAATAGRDAAQLAAPGMVGRDVADGVAQKLSDLSGRFLQDQFGGAVGAARMAGRYAVLSVAPTGEYYAAEVNDSNTCSNCRVVDGTRFDSLDEAMTAYGAGGYTSCSGGGRCRGRLITVWETDTGFAADIPVNPSFLTAVPTTVSLMSGGPPMPLPATIKAKVSAEDISRAYYKTAGYSNWITAMHVDPLELVTCDDTSGDYFRVPVTVNGDNLEFGTPVQVQVEYVDVKTPSGGGKVKARSAVYADDSGEARLSAFVWSDRAAALDLVGGEPAPTAPETVEPDVAPDVTPAGAAIRKMAAATKTPPAATTAGGSVSTDKEASGMPFDAAKLREALGLSETASADDALTAFAGALSSLGGGQTATPATPNTPPAVTGSDLSAPVTVPQLADGNRPILLDPSQLAALQDSARKGETAWAQLRRNERDGVLDEAIRLGKFPASRREYWVQLWDRDPDGTRTAVNQLAANVIPVLSQGYLGDDASQRSAADQAFEGLYGKEG